MLQKTSDKNDSYFATSHNFGTTSYNFSSSPLDNLSSHHIHHSNVWVVVMNLV